LARLCADCRIGFVDLTHEPARWTQRFAAQYPTLAGL
jgi:hypothetical protein